MTSSTITPSLVRLGLLIVALLLGAAAAVAVAPHVPLAVSLGLGALGCGLTIWFGGGGPVWSVVATVTLPLAYLTMLSEVAPWFAFGLFFFVVAFFPTILGETPFYRSNRLVSCAVAQLTAAVCVSRDVTFIELGCGDGPVLQAVARACPDLLCRGVEVHPLYVWAARLRLAREPNASVTRGNLWRYPLQDAGIVFAFLAPPPMARLWRKMTQECRPGTLLISSQFEVPREALKGGCHVASYILANGRSLHLYQVGSKVSPVRLPEISGATVAESVGAPGRRSSR